MKVTQTDVWIRPEDGEKIEFIAAMEGKEYPIFLTMYHPEYQAMTSVGELQWETGPEEITDEIAFRISLLMNRLGRLNSNRVAIGNEDFFSNEIGIDRHPAQAYPMVGLVVYAYGYQEHPY
jgi:hypothetical protein